MDQPHTDNTVPKHDMVQGTGGKADYLLVAHKGSIGLGLKPNVIAPDASVGTTYIGARIRSVMVPDHILPQDSVVHFSHLSLALDTAWPTVTWEKVNDIRASTQIGMHLMGTPDSNPELLWAAMKNRKMATDMADYLIGVVGAETLHVTREELIAWIDTIYAPATKMIQRHVEVARRIAAEIESTIGVFGMQAAMIKKVYDDLGEGSDVADIADNQQPGTSDGEA